MLAAKPLVGGSQETRQEGREFDLFVCFITGSDIQKRASHFLTEPNSDRIGVLD
ncbi:MAG: hypothetical protein RMY31_013215 [Dendronalium sp. ChiSLP03b]